MLWLLALQLTLQGQTTSVASVELSQCRHGHYVTVVCWIYSCQLQQFSAIAALDLHNPEGPRHLESNYNMTKEMVTMCYYLMKSWSLPGL